MEIKNALSNNKSMPFFRQVYQNTAEMVLKSDILESGGVYSWNFVCGGICILSNR